MTVMASVPSDEHRTPHPQQGGTTRTAHLDTGHPPPGMPPDTRPELEGPRAGPNERTGQQPPTGPAPATGPHQGPYSAP